VQQTKEMRSGFNHKVHFLPKYPAQSIGIFAAGIFEGFCDFFAILRRGFASPRT
jgi:hypothetical protein